MACATVLVQAPRGRTKPIWMIIYITVRSLGSGFDGLACVIEADDLNMDFYSNSNLGQFEPNVGSLELVVHDGGLFKSFFSQIEAFFR